MDTTVVEDYSDNRKNDHQIVLGAIMKKIIWQDIRVLLMVAGIILPVAGQSQGLPPGEGLDKILTACTACHGLENITNSHKKLTAEEWETYFYDMVARGAAIHESEMETVKKYLIDNFAVKEN